VAGPSPRSGEAEAESEPFGRARRRPSFGVEAESEPWVGRGGYRLPRLRLSPSPRVRRGGVRLPRPRLSPSSGVGRGGDRLPRSRLSLSPGSGVAELPMAPEAGLSCCQPHSVEWHSSRSGAGSAVFLSGRSVERRSDCSHFGSVD
jgi:hypothetical protein